MVDQQGLLCRCVCLSMNENQLNILEHGSNELLLQQLHSFTKGFLPIKPPVETDFDMKLSICFELNKRSQIFAVLFRTISVHKRAELNSQTDISSSSSFLKVRPSTVFRFHLQVPSRTELLASMIDQRAKLHLILMFCR